MHPSYFHPRFYYRGGPSRLIWFGFGALVATLWARRQAAIDCGPRKEYSDNWREQWHRRRSEWNSGPYETEPAPQSPPLVPNQVPMTVHSAPATPHPYQQWEDDKRAIVELTARAGDTIGDMSEATLDSIISTVEKLKSKLAEHRADRQRDLDIASKKARERHLV